MSPTRPPPRPGWKAPCHCCQWRSRVLLTVLSQWVLRGSVRVAGSEPEVQTQPPGLSEAGAAITAVTSNHDTTDYPLSTQYHDSDYQLRLRTSITQWPPSHPSLPYQVKILGPDSESRAWVRRTGSQWPGETRRWLGRRRRQRPGSSLPKNWQEMLHIIKSTLQRFCRTVQRFVAIWFLVSDHTIWPVPGKLLDWTACLFCWKLVRRLRGKPHLSRSATWLKKVVKAASMLWSTGTILNSEAVCCLESSIFKALYSK